MKTDDWIVDNVFKNHLGQFCIYNIHPNVITMIALLLSLSLPMLYHLKLHLLLFAAIIIRQTCDCLDGAVARRCQKTSKLGGIMDSVADLVFIAAMFLIVAMMITRRYTKHYYVPSFILTAVAMTILISAHVLLAGTRILYDHDSYKTYNTVSFYKYMYAFMANNSFIIAFITGILYLILTLHYKL